MDDLIDTNQSTGFNAPVIFLDKALARQYRGI